MKTQISQGICPVWSASSLSAWRKLGSLATHWTHSEDSDQTGRMPRLIWFFTGRTFSLLVWSHIWIPHWKIADTCFFLVWVISLSGVMPLWKIQSDACHILWAVHARVLKFLIWVPHGKIADPYFFLVRVISLSRVMPLWKYQNEILSARYLKKYLS